MKKILLLLLTALVGYSANATTCAGAQIGVLGANTLVCGGADDINVSICGISSYDNGNEALILYTASITGTLDIDFTGETYTGIFVYDACPTTAGTSCVAGPSTSGTASTNSLSFAITSGTSYYIMIDTWPSPNDPCNGGAGVATLTEVPPLDYCAAGSFTDPGGVASNYGNNELETYTICPNNAGDIVTVNFTLVDLENCCDNLIIYDGSGTGSTPLDGDLEAPASFTSTSADGCITVFFDSDGSATGAGWDATISCNPPPSCVAPTALTNSALTSTSTDINFTCSGCTGTYIVEYSTTSGFTAGTGATAGAGTIATGASSPISLTGLTANTDYYYTVRQDCGAGDFSANAIEQSFTTPPVAPSNDDPCSATSLTAGAACSFSTFTNAGATASAGIPAPGCASYSGGDVWFTAQASAAGILSVDMNTGVMTDAGMAIYSGSCGTLTLVECDDDDSPNGAMSAIDLTGRAANETLYIRVWEYGNNNNGTFDICAFAPIPPVAASDEPCTATVLTTSTACTFATYTNAAATGSVGPPAPGCANYQGGDVWFTAQADALGVLSVDMNTGVMTDAGMAIYSGSCGTLTLVECDDDDSPNGAMSAIDLTGRAANETLYIRVWEYGNNNNGTFDICAFAPEPPPACGTNPLPNDACSSATVLGNLNAFCGTTSSTYTVDANAAFCGSIENNSWLKFEASSTDISIDWWITGGASCVNGAQFQLFSGTCGSLTAANTCVSPTGGPGSTGVISASGLTIGDTYYIMTDGLGGDVCDYVFQAKSGIVLPVELVSFEANAVEEAISLNWITATEINNDGFEIQKSLDGKEFSKIGFVTGNGNSNENEVYTLLDKEVSANVTYYYRLKQIDFDGQFEYSDIVSARLVGENTETQVSIFPNPSNGTVYTQIAFSGESTQVVMDIYNVLGAKVSSKELTISQGNSKLVLNDELLDVGSYFVKVKINGIVSNHKFVIMK